MYYNVCMLCMGHDPRKLQIMFSFAQNPYKCQSLLRLTKPKLDRARACQSYHKSHVAHTCELARY